MPWTQRSSGIELGPLKQIAATLEIRTTTALSNRIRAAEDSEGKQSAD